MIIIKWIKWFFGKFFKNHKKKNLVAQEFQDKFKLSAEEIRKIMLLLEPEMASQKETCSPAPEDTSNLSSEERHIKRIREIMTYIDTPADNKYVAEMNDAIEKIHLLQKYVPPVDFNVEKVEAHNAAINSMAPDIDTLKKIEYKEVESNLRKAI